MGELRCATVCLPFVLSAARHCVRSHAGHVTERPRLGFPFARSAAAEANYSCVQIGHATLRRHPITGAVQGGNSITHSVADATRNWCFDSGQPAYQVAVATYRAACQGWHGIPITLRQGARVIEDIRRLRVVFLRAQRALEFLHSQDPQAT